MSVRAIRSTVDDSEESGNADDAVVTPFLKMDKHPVPGETNDSTGTPWLEAATISPVGSPFSLKSPPPTCPSHMAVGDTSESLPPDARRVAETHNEETPPSDNATDDGFARGGFWGLFRSARALRNAPFSPMEEICAGVDDSKDNESVKSDKNKVHETVSQHRNGYLWNTLLLAAQSESAGTKEEPGVADHKEQHEEDAEEAQGRPENTCKYVRICIAPKSVKSDKNKVHETVSQRRNGYLWNTLLLAAQSESAGTKEEPRVDDHKEQHEEDAEEAQGRPENACKYVRICIAPAGGHK